MTQGYVHVEVEIAQSAKKPGAPSGDVIRCDRSVAGTVIACVDGIGSGIRAHIAAEMCVSRLIETLTLGRSLHKAVDSVARTMERSRGPEHPFAAFSVARIRNDGMATVLAYDAPPAVLVSHHHASALPMRPLRLGGTLVGECNCWLAAGDGLMLTSDGITQAGLGNGLPLGWQTEGVVRFINDRLAERTLPRDIPGLVHRQARQLWQRGGDDCSVAFALCHRGQIVNILTGPPANRENDATAVRRFLNSEGLKIVCGGTTAELVARAMNRRVRIEQNPKSLIAPPRYEIDGVDLVTEGAVTLNQVYNLLDEDVDRLKEDSGVTELCALLQIADRVNFFVGDARNDANGDISFRQRGILHRDRIVPLIATKLQAAGKLVVVESLTPPVRPNPACRRYIGAGGPTRR